MEEAEALLPGEEEDRDGRGRKAEEAEQSLPMDEAGVQCDVAAAAAEGTALSTRSRVGVASGASV